MVVDLFEDLRDGTVLIRLISSLTNEKLKLQRGNLVFHRRNNINNALQALLDHGVKLVNISSDDIEGGNPKLTLALVWQIALSFNGQQLVNNLGATSLEKNLLQWATSYTQPHGFPVLNFHSSWSDGRAFLYILHANLPNGHVDLNRLLALPAIGRLQQAFTVAREELNIEQLLDPEDVYTTKPDKKSILMYVMSIYHALQSRPSEQLPPPVKENADEPVSNLLDVVLLEDKEESANIQVIENYQDNDDDDNDIPVNNSRPMSTATNWSVEISSYQTAIEEVLTLLLESEEILSRDIPPFNDLEDAKAKFRDHEEFMLKLYNHQRAVGSALEEGARLISESQFIGAGGLNLDEQNEIKQQMFLLNERWETLRIQAMDVQSKIHSQLAEVESRTIEEFRKFLTETEDRVSRYGAVDLGGSTNLGDHMKLLLQLKDDLEEKQKLVDSLSNLIVIVDDETQNFQDLEETLKALGKRWSNVVQGVQGQMESVHNLMAGLSQIEGQYQRLKNWINTRERDLKFMESKVVSEMGDVIKRVRELEYCSVDIDCCTNLLNELDGQVPKLITSEAVAAKWAEDIEDLIDRSEALKQIIEVQKFRLADMGFEFSGVAERPSHWVDFQCAIDAESTVQAKKSKLAKTDNILDLELKIIEMLNFIDSFNTSVTRVQEEQSMDCNLNELRSQLTQRIAEYGQVKDLLDACKRETVDDLSMEENQLQSIGSRYDEFVFRLEDIDKMIFMEQANKKFRTSLTGLKLVLAELRDWFRQNGNHATNEELQQQITNMESLETVDILETKHLCENNTDPQFLNWKQEFDQFLQSWKDMKQAFHRIILERTANDHSVDDDDAAMELQKCLDKCGSAKVICGEIETMNLNVVHLNELSEQLHHIESDGFDAEQLRKMQEAAKELKSKIMSQTIILENVHHFTKEHENIMCEFKKLEKSILQHDFDVSEPKAIEKLHDKFKMYGIEIKKLEIDIISLKNFCEIITEDYSKYTDQVREIVQKHTDLVELYKENKSKIKSLGPTKGQVVMAHILEIEKWLQSIEKDIQPLHIGKISNSNELFKAKLKYQNMKEVCDAKTVQFKDLNDLASEILIEVDEKNTTQKRSHSLTSMVKALTKLNSYWNDVTIDIYNKAATLERISSQLGELRTFITQENGYLDKLDQLLNKGSEIDYADAEEICEELDDLENMIRNRSEERLQKIEDIGQELAEVQFMDACILADVQSVKARWEELQDKANKRAQMLDNAAKEAQNSESKISYLLDWIAKVDVMLSEHIENDVGIEDLPHDFQRLMEEFDANHQSLDEMDELIDVYKQSNKFEAAKRLEQQLELLKSRFDTCKHKLRKFTSPQSSYESRLNRAMGELRNIERSSIVLDISSANPSSVDDQLQHSVKLYKVLSEIKGEVEVVIKTGRKVCEDTTTKNPKKLNQRIDALKHLYNNLGETVTESKKQLEYLSSLARSLGDHFELIENYLRERQLSELSPDSADSQLDLEQVRSALSKCNELYEEYASVCDVTYLGDLKDRIELLHSRLERTVRRSSEAENLKVLLELKSTLQNMNNITITTLT